MNYFKIFDSILDKPRKRMYSPLVAAATKLPYKAGTIKFIQNMLNPYDSNRGIDKFDISGMSEKRFNDYWNDIFSKNTIGDKCICCGLTYPATDKSGANKILHRFYYIINNALTKDTYQISDTATDGKNLANVCTRCLYDKFTGYMQLGYIRKCSICGHLWHNSSTVILFPFYLVIKDITAAFEEYLENNAESADSHDLVHTKRQIVRDYLENNYDDGSKNMEKAASVWDRNITGKNHIPMHVGYEEDLGYAVVAEAMNSLLSPEAIRIIEKMAKDYGYQTICLECLEKIIGKPDYQSEYTGNSLAILENDKYMLYFGNNENSPITGYAPVKGNKDEIKLYLVKQLVNYIKENTTLSDDTADSSAVTDMSAILKVFFREKYFENFFMGRLFSYLGDITRFNRYKLENALKKRSDDIILEINKIKKNSRSVLLVLEDANLDPSMDPSDCEKAIQKIFSRELVFPKIYETNSKKIRNWNRPNAIPDLYPHNDLKDGFKVITSIDNLDVSEEDGTLSIVFDFEVNEA